MTNQKSVHTIVLDAAPLILNEPSISTLLAKSEYLYTIPAVISEIRDPIARARVNTTVVPFLTIRQPNPASIKFVTDFARRTGDLAVLSKPDIGILALAYELECERNEGDWRLRIVPGQKGLNGTPPDHTAQSPAGGKATTTEAVGVDEREATQTQSVQEKLDQQQTQSVKQVEPITVTGYLPSTLPYTQETPKLNLESSETEVPDEIAAVPGKLLQNMNASSEPNVNADLQSVRDNVASLQIDSNQDSAQPTRDSIDSDSKIASDKAKEDQTSEDSDSEGWITPSNLNAHRTKDAAGPAGVSTSSDEPIMQVATITADFAMQNVLLQINLNLLSTSLHRIKYLKSHVLRCYACFATTKEMAKQFCPRCGKPALTRVSCSTTANGTFALHLKKNFQYNKRGDRFSIPKPISGTASGKVAKVNGGGKGGWGQELILAEDQKEYVKATTEQSRKKGFNLMDEDYLPGILTGERRGGPGGRLKIGGGKNVNSRKR